MTCERWQSLLSQALDDQLDSAARAALDAHLAACAACAEDMRLLRRAGAVLAASGPAEPPDDLAARVQAAILAHPHKPAAPARHTPAATRHTARAAGRSSLIERWLPIAWPAAAIATLFASALLILALQRHVATGRTPAAHDDPIAAATGTAPMPDIGVAVLALESH